MDSIAAATLKIVIQQEGFVNGVSQAQKSLHSFAEQVAATGLGFSGSMGLMNVIDKTRQALVASVKDWAEYEKAMLAVSTLVDTQKVNMAELSDQVVELSNKYGRDKKGLASALYETISSGVEAGKAMQFLETATKASIGGLTDAQTVVDGLTSSIAAYGADTTQAEEFSDSLFTTIKIGKATMDELAGTMGQVAPLANTVGLSFDELGASMATLTLSGLSTSEAGTAMRGMLNAIIQPSDDAKKMANALGLEFDMTAVKSKGFVKWLEDLTLKTGGSTKALSMLFPEVRGLNGAIQLTGPGFDRLVGSMEEYNKKSGATTDAADKMKTALSYNWDLAVQGMKNMGSSIAEDLNPALTLAAKLMASIFNPQLVSSDTKNISRIMKEFDKNEFGVSIEDLQKLYDWYDKVAKRHAEGGDKTSEQQALAQRNEVDTILEMLKAEKDFTEQVDKAKEEADKKDKERFEEEKKRAAAKAEAAARALENQKANAEKEKENSELLKRIDQERLQTSEQIDRLKTQSYLQEIEQNDKRLESLHYYNKLELTQNIESLQSKVNNEALSSQERLALNKELFDAKKRLIDLDRQYELDSLKSKTEAEKTASWEKVKNAEAELDKLEVAYKQNELDIKKSSVKNKEQKLSDLEEEYNANVNTLRELIRANETTYNSIEIKGKKAAEGVGKEFDAKLAKEFKASVEATLKINTDGGMTGSSSIFGGLLGDIKAYKELIDEAKLTHSASKAEIEAAENKLNAMRVQAGRQITDLFSQTTNVTLSALKNMKADLSVGIESLVGDIGHMVGAIGAESGNPYVAVIGEVAGILGDVLATLDEEYDLWGQKADEATQKMLSSFDKINQSLDLSIRKTAEWLGLVSDKDYSNMSKADLRSEQSNLSNKMAEMVSTSTGVQITGKDWLNLSTLPSDRYISADQNILDEGLKRGNISQSQYDTLVYVRGLKASNGISTMNTYSGFASALDKTKTTSSPAITKIQNALNTNFSGIDPISSQSKDDFLADLQTQLDTKKITEQQYNDLYYQAVTGTGNFKGRKWGGMATSDWFSAEERAKAEFNLTNIDSSQSSSGSNFLNSLPSVQSAPISIVGQEAIASAMAPSEVNNHLTIEIKVDPNIPYNDVAQDISERIASSASRMLISKGLN